ncbi:hypothetical protein GWI33_017484 [Rhynchophorus ferrugineus]|uniref:Uncharacterized protein n=1 Tax=Rhynchophorus ferrugineus TaxID=354439 RepID=A0A834M2D9_RHYFE|nr:hypothetical protein GWI33_017484 [Rhynchophorus ferrugineus]
MAEAQPKRVIIPSGTLDPNEHNVVEIPEGYEDSQLLIAKLQAKLSRPPRYYPPLTNPENKFERKIGDRVVARGLPPLSPLKEERRDYMSSFKEYGRGRKVYGESCEPSYFERDTTCASNNISGKFDYCPSSTPVPDRLEVPIPANFPSPRLSPIRLGRDLFAPEPSVYRSPATPLTVPPRPSSPSPRSPSSRSPSPSPPRYKSPNKMLQLPRIRISKDQSCSLGEASDMLSFNQSSKPSPRRLAPPRQPSPRGRSHVSSRRGASSEQSCSLENVSDMVSFDVSRGMRSSRTATPQSIKGLSKLGLSSANTTISDELSFSAVNESMHKLESMEVEELMMVQQKMKSFQDARRDLLVSILTLPEPECL